MISNLRKKFENSLFLEDQKFCENHNIVLRTVLDQQNIPLEVTLVCIFPQICLHLYLRFYAYPTVIVICISLNITNFVSPEKYRCSLTYTLRPEQICKHLLVRRNMKFDQKEKNTKTVILATVYVFILEKF